MVWSPENSLIIGISSRALFKLDEEDRIYEAEGTEAFIGYQRDHEEEIVAPGVAFPLIKALLTLNQSLRTEQKPAIEVVIVSKNHPDCAIRLRRSIERHDLWLRRAVFTGGQDILPYLRALHVDLFLSKEEGAVRAALANGISAGLIYGGPEEPKLLDGTPVFAFDGDAVLFSDDADQLFEQGKLQGFEDFEFQNLKTALPPGPLHRFAVALEELRAGYPVDEPPFRIALVTARALAYCERPIRTLRNWGIRVDQSFFLDGMAKGILLPALKPLIFFDDSLKNCEDACTSTPTVRVLRPETTKLVVAISSAPGKSPERFLGVCKLFLKKSFTEHETALLQWHEANVAGLTAEAYANFTDEFERSAKGTPLGRQRRAHVTADFARDGGDVTADFARDGGDTELGLPLIGEAKRRFAC